MATLPFEVLLLDIEGTTTSISFVYDALFPYARAAVEDFLTRHHADPAVAADLALLRDQARADAANGEDAPQLPAEAEGPALVSAAVANVRWQMDRDRKTTGLKSLQGKIWREGYQSGELRGHVFEEVPAALAEVVARGGQVCIYSSGSVAAQQLIFGYSIAGDLTAHLSGYFDTTTGPKREAASYAAIAAALGRPPEALCFVTDVLPEADAARDAGLQARLIVRPGNPPQPPHDHPVVADLAAVLRSAD